MIEFVLYVFKEVEFKYQNQIHEYEALEKIGLSGFR